MKIIIGLGNPGENYEKTRHNAGKMAVEHFAKKNKFQEWESSKKYQSLVSEDKIGKEKVLLLLPETFMNNSGKAVKEFSAKNVIVMHDDIDLSLGKFKISIGRGHGGHKGVASIIRALKTKDFVRIRIGVAPRKKPDHKKMPDFLTSCFRAPELQILSGVFKKTSKALETTLLENPQKAMNLFN